MPEYTFDVAPVPKPRMTRRDVWLKPPRPCVARYRAYADRMRLAARRQGFEMPEAGADVTFEIAMPKRWPKYRRREMAGEPHQQVPDVDNLCKSLLDALLPGDDSHVHDIRIRKVWAEKPRITIRTD